MIVLITSCQSRTGYHLSIDEINDTPGLDYQPVYSETPNGERYVWEMRESENFATKAFIVSFRDSIIILEHNLKSIGKKGDEVRKYRVTLDLNDKNRFKLMNLWANVYELDSVRKGVPSGGMTAREYERLTGKDIH
jgi:hypothetical protein